MRCKDILCYVAAITGSNNRPFDTKPLSKSVLGYYQKTHISVDLNQNAELFIDEMYRNCRVRDISHVHFTSVHHNKQT